MDMHYGHKRDPIHLYKLEISKNEGFKPQLQSGELKSDPSIDDQDLYSNNDHQQQSTSFYVPAEESPRASTVQFKEPLIKGQDGEIMGNNTITL